MSFSRVFVANRGEIALRIARGAVTTRWLEEAVAA